MAAFVHNPYFYEGQPDFNEDTSPSEEGIESENLTRGMDRRPPQLSLLSPVISPSLSCSSSSSFPFSPCGPIPEGRSSVGLFTPPLNAFAAPFVPIMSPQGPVALPSLPRNGPFVPLPETIALARNYCNEDGNNPQGRPMIPYLSPELDPVLTRSFNEAPPIFSPLPLAIGTPSTPEQPEPLTLLPMAPSALSLQSPPSPPCRHVRAWKCRRVRLGTRHMICRKCLARWTQPPPPGYTPTSTLRI